MSEDKLADDLPVPSDKNPGTFANVGAKLFTHGRQLADFLQLEGRIIMRSSWV